MIDQALWEKRHRTGIGGSGAPAVLGISPWKSRLGLWEEITGEVPPREISDRMIWGSRLEKAILQGYAEDQGTKVLHVGFRRHPEMRHIIGHPDGITTEGKVVEAKTSDHLSEAWGPEGSDQVPEHYWTQIQHYLLLLGAQEADLALLVRGNQPKVYRIPVDRGFQVELANEEGSFWRDHVVAGVPPDPDSSEDARAVLSRLFGRKVPEEIVANDVQRRIAWDLLDLKKQEKGLEERIRGMENTLKVAMGSRQKMVGDGFSITWSRDAQGKVSWKNVAGVYRKAIESMIEDGLVEVAGVPVDESWPDTVEGLYRGEPGDRFLVSDKRRKGDPE